MFKVIGAVVVYGFATFGLVSWLGRMYGKPDRPGASSQ